METIENVTTTEETEIAAAKIVLLASTYMAEVKMSNVFTGNVLNMSFCRAKVAGEKFSAETAERFDTLSFDCSELPENIFIDCDAARHGIKQKMGDSLAPLAKETTTIREAGNTLTALWNQLKDGNWNAPTKSTKQPTVTVSALEAVLLANVASGAMAYEIADSIIFSQTGKHLPKD